MDGNKHQMKKVFKLNKILKKLKKSTKNLIKLV